MSFYLGTHLNYGFAFSLDHDPYSNLAFEEWLLREGMHFNSLESLLFLYRNKECVVSGRFQIPWKELNFKSPLFSHEQYIRRKSGGGTVYHDLGNWNFCFFHRGKDLKRKENLAFIQKVVKKLGVEIHTNERHDLLFSNKKVSGSAFKQTKDYCYHHGTLLVEAKLNELKGLLGNTSGFQITGKGIASVSSPVTNLRDHGLSGGFTDFVKSATSAWGVPWENVALFEEAKTFIKSYREELKNPKWRWAETPKHRLLFSSGLEIEVEKGRILSSTDYKDCLEGLELFSLSNIDGFSCELKAQKALCEELLLILLKNA